MENTINIAHAYEHSIAYRVLLWDALEDADEAAIAKEAVGFLFAFTTSWLEPVALEARIGLYDREIFTEAAIKPPARFHMLLLDPAPPSVRVSPMYQPIVSRVASLNVDTAAAWIASKRAEANVADARYEVSLRGLLVPGCRVRLPDGVTGSTLSLTCYTGTIQVPIEHRDGGAWISAPQEPDGIPDSVSLRITNQDGGLRLILYVSWSPWVDELDQPSPLSDSLKRLEALGWTPNE